MNSNDQLINNFYSSFAKKDWQEMNAQYSEDIIFSDPVFGMLREHEPKAMWEMLCKSAKDLTVTYGNIIQLDDEYSTCDWVATYTFSKTGRKVVNRVRANMRFAEGKIIEHSDAFSLHKWSSQALGFSGWLLGWNRFFQNKIKNQAKGNLLKFMQAKMAG